MPSHCIVKNMCPWVLVIDHVLYIYILHSTLRRRVICNMVTMVNYQHLGIHIFDYTMGGHEICV